MGSATFDDLATWLGELSLDERAAVLSVTDPLQLAALAVCVGHSRDASQQSGQQDQIPIALFEWQWLEAQLSRRRRGGTSRRAEAGEAEEESGEAAGPSGPELDRCIDGSLELLSHAIAYGPREEAALGEAPWGGVGLRRSALEEPRRLLGLLCAPSAGAFLADPLPPPPPPGKLRLGCIGWLRRRSLLDSGAILAGWLEVRLRAAHARRLEGGPEAHLVQESLHRAVRLRRYLAAAPQART